MGTFLYRCPKTGFKIQGWSDDTPAGADAYVSVACPVCSQTHLVSPVTGRGPSDGEDTAED